MKVALITGGAGAIGSATARMLAGDGYSLVLVDKSAEPALALAAEVRELQRRLHTRR